MSLTKMEKQESCYFTTISVFISPPGDLWDLSAEIFLLLHKLQCWSHYKTATHLVWRSPLSNLCPWQGINVPGWTRYRKKKRLFLVYVCDMPISLSRVGDTGYICTVLRPCLFQLFCPGHPAGQYGHCTYWAEKCSWQHNSLLWCSQLHWIKVNKSPVEKRSMNFLSQDKRPDTQAHRCFVPFWVRDHVAPSGPFTPATNWNFLFVCSIRDEC